MRVIDWNSLTNSDSLVSNAADAFARATESSGCVLPGSEDSGVSVEPIAVGKRLISNWDLAKSIKSSVNQSHDLAIQNIG